METTRLNLGKSKKEDELAKNRSAKSFIENDSLVRSNELQLDLDLAVATLKNIMKWFWKFVILFSVRILMLLLTNLQCFREKNLMERPIQSLLILKDVSERNQNDRLVIENDINLVQSDRPYESEKAEKTSLMKLLQNNWNFQQLPVFFKNFPQVHS